MFLSLFAVTGATAADWPMYRHDAERSGVTAEALAFPLMERWVYRAPSAPVPAWPAPQINVERPKVSFDNVLQTIAVGDAIYFSSSVDNQLHALDGDTGRTRWRFFTDAPARLAPTFANGRLFFGADDGKAYCVNASDGALVWSYNAAPRSTRVVGNGRVMSLFPVRTDVLVDDNRVYFGSGIIPYELPTYVSLDAGTGEPVAWKDRNPKSWINYSPQGYQVKSSRGIVVPNGRGMPVTLDTRSANPVYRLIASDSRNAGGDYETIIGDRIYIGTQGKLHVFDTRTGEAKLPWAAARMVVASRDSYFTFSVPGLPALLPLRGSPQRACLTAFDRAAADRSPERDPTSSDAPVRWRRDRADVATIILAGDRLIAGCDGQVIALDAATGADVWSSKVDGVAVGLTFANGRLLVSTTTGAIYCFGAKAERESTPSVPQSSKTIAENDEARRIVDGLLRETSVTRGFALVLGRGAPDVAIELAKRSELKITCVEPDAARLRLAREHIDAAGLYGHRVTVNDMLSAAGSAAPAFPFPDYAGNLVVNLGTAGDAERADEEWMRVLKPCGGVLMYASSPSPALVEAWRKAGEVTREIAVTDAHRGWTKVVRGELPGSGWWTHTYGDAGNSGSSGDRLVKDRLEVLWFGEPGPAEFVERHLRATAPLVWNGRVFTQGWNFATRKNSVICFDAYNGLRLWDRELPGALRLSLPAVSGNIACAGDSVYVVTDSRCHRLDAVTGKTISVYETPARADGSKPLWSYLAIIDGTLVGGTTSAEYKPDFHESRRNKLFGDDNDGSRYSDAVFAINITTGSLAWKREFVEVRDSTIAVAGGRVLMVENRAGPTTRPFLNPLVKGASLKEARANPDDESAHKPYGSDDSGDSNDAGEVDRLGRRANPANMPPMLRTVLALELTTGKTAWEKEVDLAGCGRWDAAPQQAAPGYGEIQALCKDGVLLLAAAYHQHDSPSDAEKQARRAKALSVKDGSEIWTRSVSNRNRPIILGQTFLAGDFLRDLRTGDPLTKRNGKTGADEPWLVVHGHACGTPAACDSIVFYRGGWRNIGSGKFDQLSGIRAGCFINVIPAGGIVVQPEASTGCTCSYNNLYLVQCSIAFKPVAPR